eukprot:986003-Amphidinium_carterae.1
MRGTRAGYITKQELLLRGRGSPFWESRCLLVCLAKDLSVPRYWAASAHPGEKPTGCSMCQCKAEYLSILKRMEKSELEVLQAHASDRWDEEGIRNNIATVAICLRRQKFQNISYHVMKENMKT